MEVRCIDYSWSYMLNAYWPLSTSCADCFRNVDMYVLIVCGRTTASIVFIDSEIELPSWILIEFGDPFRRKAQFFNYTQQNLIEAKNTPHVWFDKQDRCFRVQWNHELAICRQTLDDYACRGRMRTINSLRVTRASVKEAIDWYQKTGRYK